MPENVSIADGEEILWLKRALWLLIHEFYGGSVVITDLKWERAPERPVLVIDRADGLMKWTAKECGDEKGAES